MQQPNKRRVENREIRHLLAGEQCKQAIGDIYKNMEIFGLTKGQFSFINLIQELLKQTGKAKVIIASWTVGNADITFIEDFIKDALIEDFILIIDSSFKNRQSNCFESIQKKGFKVFETKSHAKFALIFNEDWKITVNTSMNLNENKRIENYQISDDDSLFNYLFEISKDISKTDYSSTNFDLLGHSKKYKIHKTK